MPPKNKHTKRQVTHEIECLRAHRDKVHQQSTNCLRTFSNITGFKNYPWKEKSPKPTLIRASLRTKYSRISAEDTQKSSEVSIKVLLCFVSARIVKILLFCVCVSVYLSVSTCVCSRKLLQPEQMKRRNVQLPEGKVDN